MIIALIFLAREHLCALIDTTTQVDNQDFRSDYSPINNLFELDESLDYYDPYICYWFSWKFELLWVVGGKEIGSMINLFYQKVHTKKSESQCCACLARPVSMILAIKALSAITIWLRV